MDTLINSKNMKTSDQFLLSKTKTGKVGRYHLAFRNITAIERVRGGDWLIRNHSAEHRLDLAKVANIALHGVDKTVQIPMEFLLDCGREHVAIVFAQLNSDKIQILEPQFTHGIDHVTGLHAVRRSEKKSTHVARELIKAQLYNRLWSPKPDQLKKLMAAKTTTALRFVEAELAHQYWNNWYANRRLEISRRDDHPVNDALNATSAHLAQIVSRHLINHRLPLEFGIHHVSTYSHSLVYDLMEPFRGFTERAVEEALIARSDNLLEDSLGNFTNHLESYYTYRQGTEKKSLQQLMEMTVMNLAHYGNSQLQTDNSARFWVPKIGRRKFARLNTCGTIDFSKVE